MMMVFMTVNGRYGHFGVSAADMPVGAVGQLIR